MNRTTPLPRMLEGALASGPKTAAELQALLGVSQPTISRAIQASAGGVAVLGAGRATRYALYAPIEAVGPVLPVYQVDEAGRISQVGDLHVLHDDRFWWARQDEKKGELFDGIPWFLGDMRPQGFLGRSFPLQHADLGLPPRIVDWQARHAICAMARRGEDLPGNRVIGKESFARLLELALKPRVPVPVDGRPLRYEELADKAMSGTDAGSSAGGEQPKFAVSVKDNRKIRHVIVKFSPAEASGVGRRWRDLLIAEHHALRTLSDHHIVAADSELVHGRQRSFLEVVRFDRIGLTGRSGVISIGSADAEFHGRHRDWIDTARALISHGVLDAEDAARIERIHAFGRLILNTDMHMGNLSLHETHGRLKLAPVYDMLPMGYAPRQGETPALAYALPPVHPDAPLAHVEMLPVAGQFWQRIAEDPAVSAELQAVARSASHQISEAVERAPRVVSVR